MHTINKIITLSFVSLIIFCNAHAAHPRKGNFAIKARGGYMDINDDIKNGENGTKATQKFKNGLILDGALNYFITDNIAVEVSPGIGFIEYQKLDSTKKSISLLPITATAQFYLPIYDKVMPYLGGGYSHTFFFNEPTNVKINDGGSGVAQVGVDLYVLDHIFHDGNFHNVGINIDAKYFFKAKHEITELTEKFKNDLSRFTVTAGLTVVF